MWATRSMWASACWSLSCPPWLPGWALMTQTESSLCSPNRSLHNLQPNPNTNQIWGHLEKRRGTPLHWKDDLWFQSPFLLRSETTYIKGRANYWALNDILLGSHSWGNEQQKIFVSTSKMGKSCSREAKWLAWSYWVSQNLCSGFFP